MLHRELETEGETQRERAGAGSLSLSPDLLTKPLLGSQGPCSAQSGATALQHFILVCGRGSADLEIGPLFVIQGPYFQSLRKINVKNVD